MVSYFCHPLVSDLCERALALHHIAGRDIVGGQGTHRLLWDSSKCSRRTRGNQPEGRREGISNGETNAGSHSAARWGDSPSLPISNPNISFQPSSVNPMEMGYGLECIVISGRFGQENHGKKGLLGGSQGPRKDVARKEHRWR